MHRPRVEATLWISRPVVIAGLDPAEKCLLGQRQFRERQGTLSQLAFGDAIGDQLADKRACFIGRLGLERTSRRFHNIGESDDSRPARGRWGAGSK